MLFSPIEKITQNKTIQCFGWVLSVSFIGGLDESQRSQGMQSSFSCQISSIPPASASWRNSYWTLMICTPKDAGHANISKKKETVTTEWLHFIHAYHSHLLLFNLDLTKTAFALCFYLDSDDWELFLCIKVEGKTPVASIWMLGGLMCFVVTFCF